MDKNSLSHTRELYCGLGREKILKSFILAVSVVMPLMIYMLIGRIIRKAGIFSEECFRTLNAMVFRVFIPLTLFFDIYEADVGNTVRPGIFFFVVAGIMVSYVLAWRLASRRVDDKKKASTMIQGMYRSNYVLFGNSIAASLCGKDGMALVAALTTVVVPLFNVLAVVLFEIKRGGDIEIKKIIVNIFKNPLVEAGIFGMIFSVLHIPIPQVIREPLKELAAIATPLALVTLGGYYHLEVWCVTRSI